MAINKIAYNILVIEDNVGDFTLVEDFLFEQIEAPVISKAQSFKTAKEILENSHYKFDIILLDLSLPDKTGELLIRGIVEICEGTPVIVLTGYADFAFGVKSLSLGVSDYILKDELNPLSLYKSIMYSSERKKTVAALEGSEKRYSELFHLSPLPMWVLDLDNLNFLDVNDAAIKHYGYSREEFSSMTIRDIEFPGDSSEIEILFEKDIDNQKMNNSGIYRHIKKSGEIINVDMQSNFIEYKGKKSKVMIANDITDRLNYIKAIEEQNEKLRDISWMQSHVIRAPLAKIMGLIPLINDTKENSKEREKMLEYLKSSANELDEVIGNIIEK